MEKLEDRPLKNFGKQRPPSTQKTSTATRTCLLVLGMHRSGTSALTRTLNLLGYSLPEKLIGAAEGNDAGHWEPENIVLFNDQLLSDMGSTWHDFRSLSPSRLGPVALQNADLQLRDLLQREFGDAPHIILKDPRICRLAPFYIQALEHLHCRIVPLIAFRNPAEVMRSLQRRRSNWPTGLGDSVAALMWLRHVLDAEVASRNMPRSFINYAMLTKDWQSEIQRIANQGSFDFPEPVIESAPLIGEFLRPDLNHERIKEHDISGQPALRGWCMRAHDALKRLVIDPHSESAMAVLDIIRRDFDAAELPLSDMANGDAVRINLLQEEIARAQYESCNWQEREQAARQRIEGQDTQIGELNAELRRLEADQQVLTQSLNDAREREQAATQRIEGQDTQIGELNAELRRLETDQQVLRQSLNDAREREQAARQRIEGQDTQIGELNTELRRLEADQQVLTQSLNDAREREQAAKQQIEEQLSQILEMTLSLTDAQEMLGWHERKLAEMNELLHNRNLDYDKLQLISQLRVDQIYKTRSWRVTAPMRQVSTKLRNIRIAVNTFQSASRNLGGPLAAASATTRILVKEGPRGIGRRLSRHRYIAHLDAQGVNKSSAHQCYIAATPHVMSLAQLMARVLREEGFLVSVGTDLDGADGATHVFVICPQMFDNIPEHYIAVQMEQSVSSRWFTEAYFDSLNRARAIIDYSMTNLDYLGRHDLPLYKLHYIPLDVDRNLLPSDEAPRQGILFYGDDKCPRRQRILSAVADAYPQLRIVNNLFGEEIDQELKRAAVVLNVHYYEGSLLETTRIYQALSHGTPVVSEVSADQDEHAVLHGIVEFAPVDDTDRIIELLRPYIDNDIHAIAQRERIRSFTARDDNRFEMFFRRFLLAQNMVGYDVMSTRAPNYPISVPEPAHLCLSLPETPRRRALFAGQMQPGFTIWDGLKATPGWIGAAMSYRHMFKRIVASGTQRAIICEDDVLFPTDYNQRMAVVERYLEHHEWDLFSGFIADAHDDIVVSAVVDFEGVRFVHVNRAVSMVFNIYNRGIMEYLAEWDPTDKDVDRNTIDRYLERREDTKVILTLPFLVGHRPDTTSTIWGFDNTQYDAVIEKSELLLTEKVEEFLRKTRSGS